MRIDNVKQKSAAIEIILIALPLSILPVSLPMLAAKIYEALKIRLWKEFPDDRDSYVNGKHELITDYLQKAREWRKKYVGEAD